MGGSSSVRLTFSDAEEVRVRHAAGETLTSMAPEYGVSIAALSAITRGKSHVAERVLMTREETLRRKRNAHLLNQFGITVEQWEEMLEACGYRCESCGRHAEELPVHHRSGGVFLVCDHDHATGEVRGVLCTNCNIALGHVGDSPERLKALLNYLETR